MPIYLDNHATTQLDPRVADVVLRTMTEVFGNSSSVDHVFGDEAEAIVSQAAGQIAALLQCPSNEIVFTSGATEGINLGLAGFALSFRRRFNRRPIFAVSSVEHRAVLETARALARRGEVQLVELEVDASARLKWDEFHRTLQSGVDLVAVMAANNEVGTVYPLAEISQSVANAGAVLFCDATQAVGKIPIDLSASQVGLLTLSAHKFYGPKGVGALVVGPEVTLDPILFGGGQQRGIRPGTLNVPAIAGLGEACRLARLEMSDDAKRVGGLRDRLQELLTFRIDSLVVNGDVESRLPGNLHVSIPGIQNSVVISRLRDSIAMATGAACSSGIESPSHVLVAMGLERSLQEGALRLGLGRFTSDEEVVLAAEQICHAAEYAKSV